MTDNQHWFRLQTAVRQLFQMICVFDVIEGPARGKRFWLRANQRMAVGRISTADFAVPADAHMSRHHLLLEANCEVIRLRDVGSANGTFVNESRINSLELQAGDKIRAGSTVLELSVLADHEDPHSKDGLTIATLTGKPLSGKSQATDKTVQGHDPSSNNSIQSVSGTIAQALGNPPDAESLIEQESRPVGTRVIRLPPEGLDSAASQELIEPSHDGESTLRLEVQWWMPFFQPSKSPGFLEAKPLNGEMPSLVDVLRSAPASKPIALVVNQSQLGRHALATLRQSVDSRLITPLSHALVLVRFDASESVWKLMESSLQQDAVTCLCAKKSFELKWINDLLDQLSYPSMLSSLLKANDRSLQARLKKHVSFAIFEQSRTGDLAMYVSED